MAEHSRNRPDARHTRPDGIVLTRASEVEPQPVSWMWEGYIPRGTLSILSGEPGINKSTMAFGIAAGLSTGKSGAPANSLILTAEDSFSTTVVPRLLAAGADLERIAQLEKRRDGLISHLQFPEDTPDLYDAIRRFAAELVDPRIAGSLGVAAAARSVMQMVRDPSDSRQRILTSTKLNVGKVPPGIIYRLEPAIVGSDAGPIRSMRLARCGTTAATSDQLLKPERKTKHARAVELLYEVLPNGQPVELDEIKRCAEEEGLAWRVVQKARTDIGCITTAAEGGATKWTLQS